jgi:hypothetical protein
MKKQIDWQPISTIPLDEEVHLRWADGATAIGMLMSPPPIEISKDRRFWWGVDAMSYADGDWSKERDSHQPDEAVEWAAMAQTPIENCLPV